jgi:hypothetical protein
MNEIRLGWEPENTTPLADIEERFRGYMHGKSSGVSLLGNGTLLFTEEGRDDEEDMRRAMEEAKLLIDFQVTPLKESGYLVSFHRAVAVFVGQGEFEARRAEIAARLEDLKFPEERLIGNGSSPDDHLLIGLYARGKLQRDAYHPKFYKRIRSE